MRVPLYNPLTIFLTLSMQYYYSADFSECHTVVERISRARSAETANLMARASLLPLLHIITTRRGYD